MKLIKNCQTILYPHTAKRRYVLGCTSPTTKRFPEAQEMSRGRSPRDILRAEGNLEVRGDVQSNSSRFEAVYGHSLIPPSRSDRVAKLNQKAKGTHELRNHNKINFKTPKTCFRLGMDSKHSFRHRRFIKVQNFCTFFWNISKTTTHPPTYATSAFYIHAGPHFT